MSQPGPYARTRAASRTSRESTPTAANPARAASRDAQEATPATARRTTGRAANRVTPAPRDGDDSLPPVSNKNSKAYGSSGRAKKPKQMDLNEAMGRPDMAIDAALAQKSARNAGFLPVLAEDDGESQAHIDQQLRNDIQYAEKSAARHHGASEGDADEDGGAEQTFGPFDISAWATRVAEEGTWFERLKRSLRHMVNTILGLCLMIADDFIYWYARRTAWQRFQWFSTLFFTFVLLDVMYGPFHPVLDSANMRALRPATGKYLDHQEGPPFEWKRLVSIEDQISVLNTKFLNAFHHNTKSEIAPRINWFECGQGAIIDPQLSSPSIVAKGDFALLTYIASLFALRQHAAASRPFSRTPVEALMHWDDGGLDRWCAPASRGKLQLTVSTARPIAPKELVVEHIAKGASIYIGMAPKEVELWIEIDDPDIRSELHTAISASDPSLLVHSSPQLGKELADAQALSSDFMLVGRFLYDIDTNQAIQSFKIPFDLAFSGVKSTRFAVRVNSNWGSYDSTCINRLRLYGTDMSGEGEELEGEVRL